jgi:O-ureido-D-serine cyclo-ligase
MDELQLAGRVLAALPFGAPLYARIDLIRDAEGAPCVLEVELTEPSLFFAYASTSADRFAAAILKALATV